MACTEELNLLPEYEGQTGYYTETGPCAIPAQSRCWSPSEGAFHTCD